MARPLISQRTVGTIHILRDRGWETAFATSDPQVSLVLVRPPEDEEDDGLVDAQDVVVEYPTSNQIAATIQGGGAVESLAWAIFRRPLSYGFDVLVGDTFALDGKFGEIRRVWEEQGMIRAQATLDVGTP